MWVFLEGTPIFVWLRRDTRRKQLRHFEWGSGTPKPCGASNPWRCVNKGTIEEARRPVANTSWTSQWVWLLRVLFGLIRTVPIRAALWGVDMGALEKSEADREYPFFSGKRRETTFSWALGTLQCSHLPGL